MANEVSTGPFDTKENLDILCHPNTPFCPRSDQDSDVPHRKTPIMHVYLPGAGDWRLPVGWYHPGLPEDYSRH
ncbi:hypothetical protein ACHAPK_011875, partial [Fusarium culmorum]